LVTVNIKNCWDCKHFGLTIDYMDYVCEKHNILLWNRFGNMLPKKYWNNKDCSCKEPVECDHNFEIVNKGNLSLEHMICKKCHITKPGILWKPNLMPYYLPYFE
jgi:hypothetical protein